MSIYFVRKKKIYINKMLFTKSFFSIFTALEAVRKAHSEELQRQVQKFKDEFVLKMNKRFETEAFKKCYE